MEKDEGKMGLIKAFGGSISGVFADQWLDFYTLPFNLPATVVTAPATLNRANSSRTTDKKNSEALITNGSKILVPEGFGLVLVQDGAITGYSSEPGGYIWQADDPNSQSIFAGDKIVDTFFKQSWERFKFGGQPSSQQIALYVRLGELPGNKFGTQSPIYWDDAYINAQVGAVTHGTYSIYVVDPIKFVAKFLPAPFLQGSNIYDLADKGNESALQLRSEVVGSLAAAFSDYTNDKDRANRITKIQADSAGFTTSLANVLDTKFGWQEMRGLRLESAALIAIEYDDDSKEVLKSVQRADALSGNRAATNLQASVAEGIVLAGAEGAQGILGLGIAGSALGIGGLIGSGGSLISPSGTTDPANPKEDQFEYLRKLKEAWDAGLINQEEYEAAKAKALGI